MKPVRVLVVDDSAFARKVIREVLSRDREVEVVGIARDGAEALEKIGELRPDVITLDLVMPDLDGLGVLRALPKEDAPKVVVVSISGSESDLAIEALELGAVDLVTKPTPLATDRLYELSGELLAKVKAAASARPRRGVQPLPRVQVSPPPGVVSPVRLVVIGTSTGGPHALTQLFSSLPADLPVPIVIALHIPAGYTAPLAARISQSSAVPVEEAKAGQELLPGRALLAPGSMHLRVHADGGRLYAGVSHEPADSLHHPSVDVLLESAVEAVGDGVLALVMTGMGDDGKRGAIAVHAAGGRVLAEAASSRVVYGMPRSVVEAGVTSGVAPLEKLPELLVGAIYGYPAGAPADGTAGS